MSRKSEIERKKKLLAEIMAGKSADVKEKAVKKEEKQVDADVNKDGVVDEKDVQEVKKKIKKKKD